MLSERYAQGVEEEQVALILLAITRQHDPPNPTGHCCILFVGTNTAMLFCCPRVSR